MKNLAGRICSMGPGGRKCTCCNPFHGKSKPMLNRLVRRRLNVYFNKEVRSELSPE